MPVYWWRAPEVVQIILAESIAVAAERLGISPGSMRRLGRLLKGEDVGSSG